MIENPDVRRADFRENNPEPSSRLRRSLYAVIPDVTETKHREASMMKTRIDAVAIPIVLAIAATGCFTLAPRTIMNPPTASFVYDTPDSGGVLKSDVTIAIVRPVVRATDVGQAGLLQSGAVGALDTDIEVTRQVEAMKQSFVASAKKDLDRIMIAKGMRTMGPFDSFDELTFSEKKNATYALVPQIELKVAWPHSAPSGQHFDVNGTLTVGGEFQLVLSEPLSGQKIWSKRLSIPNRSDSFAVSTHVETNVIAMWDETKDNRAEVAARLLTVFYKDLMDTISKQADAQEFVALKNQSDELKRLAAPTMR